MTPPLRVLRAMVLGRIGRRPLTETQRLREAEIIDVAAGAMALFGRNKIRFRALAQALRICTDTLRWHFADMDELLGEIITRHLKTIQAAIAEIPAGAEDRHQRIHQALTASALTKSGTLTEAHTLLLRERQFLPADVLQPISETWAKLCATLQPALPDQALTLLEDLPPLTETQQTQETQAEPPPAPAPPPPPAEKPAASATAQAARRATSINSASSHYPTAEELSLLAAARAPHTLQQYLDRHGPLPTRRRG